MDSDQLREFEENIRRINEMLSEQSSLQAGLLKGMKDQLNVLKSGTTASKLNTTAINSQTEASTTSTKLAEAERKAKEQQTQTTQNYNKALSNGERALLSFTSALISGEKGFAKYGTAVSNAGDAAQDLGKNFGALGKTFGFLINIGSKVVAENLKLTDAQIKFKDQFSELGQLSNGTTERLASLANQAGYSFLDLQKLSKPLQTAGSALTIMNNASQSGSETFLKMANVGKEARMRFERLGVTQEELTDMQAEYIALQRSSGIILKEQAKDSVKLKNASLEYADQLVGLSILTGKNIEQIKAEQKEALTAFEENMRRYQAQAKIAQLDKQIKETKDETLRKSLQQQRDNLAQEQANRDMFLKEASGSIDSRVANLFSKVASAPGGAFLQGTEELARIGMDAGRIYEAVTSGDQKKIDALMQEYFEKSSGMALKLGPAAVMNEGVAGQFGLTSSTMQNTEVIRAEMASGKTYAEAKAIADARKAEQEKNTEEGKIIDSKLEDRSNLTELEITSRTTYSDLVDSIDLTDMGLDKFIISITDTVNSFKEFSSILNNSLASVFPSLFKKTTEERLSEENTAKKNTALRGTGYTALPNMQYRAPDGSTVLAANLPVEVKRQLNTAGIPGLKFDVGGTGTGTTASLGSSSSAGPNPESGVGNVPAYLLRDRASAPGDDQKLLDFIGNIEARGDYNMLVGGKTNSSLTEMTVAQVLEFQQRMLASGHESTAVGKYQIINQTLRGLVKSGAVKLTDIFNQSTQDKAAIALMNMRGRLKFLAGKIDIDTYANNLAKEWASLPMADGRSFYAGKGSNRSLVSRTDFVNALKARNGGVFTGSDSATRGTEIVAPLQKDSILMQLAKTPLTMPEKKTTSAKPGAAVKPPATPESIALMNTELMQMISNKVDVMLDILDESNMTSNKLLKRSSV